MDPELLLENLDPEQRLAAESLVGPTCILAGAGTGKTTTVTHRIAYGIATGFYAANRVLALTYTNRAAGELRARLRQLGVGAVSVKTFHAAALSQLEFFWPQFAGVPAPAVLQSKARMISEVADSVKIRLDAGAVRDFAAEIEWRKYSMLSLEQYAEVVSSRPKVAGLSPSKNVELQAAYEEAKVKAQKIDWEDVLVLTLGLLRAEPRALAHVHQQYRFFTVDEYQDISPLQHALLDTWLGNHSDICVVGDPNQTIYSFTGATSEFLQNFGSRYEGSVEVQLTRNYRSTQQIVNFANRLTQDSSAVEPLVSQGEPGLAPRTLSFATVADECAGVAQAIRVKLDQGVKPSDIAVLYRVNGQSEAIENALAHAGIDYQVRGGERFFNRPEVQNAIRAIRAQAVAPIDKSLFEAVSDICRSLGWQAQQPQEHGSAREKWESLNSLLAITEELPAGSTVMDFAKELEERQRSQHEPIKAAVTLSTIHAAKGLEWPYVFVVGLTEGYLPISYAVTPAEIREEQRLLYVGLTRAKKELTLSWARRDAVSGRDREPSRFFGLLQPRG
ncbi:ATP-dependent helicase [Rhodoluna limnophila]|uniref:ATP-dependent helicase n=1 Tax=Rhodoluna limnophila TaxID=232537 RepID=UPI001107317A|nr:ATP-dependent helicase [Rhodoluna limnophila]